MPDGIGLFGLVDDLEAIRIALERLYPNYRSELILQEFLSLEPAIHSLLVEREHPEFNGALPFLGLSKPLQMCIGGIRYLLENKVRKTLAVLPDRGLMLLRLPLTR